MLAKECMKSEKKLLKTTMKKDIWKQTCLTFAREGSIPRIDIENECSYQMNRIQFIENESKGNTPPPNKIRMLMHEERNSLDNNSRVMRDLQRRKCLENDSKLEQEDAYQKRYPRRSLRLEERNMKRKKKEVYENTLFDEEDDDDE